MFTMSIGFGTVIVLFFIMMLLGRVTSKFRHLRYIIPILGALFFLVNAYIDKEMLYPSLFFFLIFGVMGIRYFSLQRKQSEEENKEERTT